MVNLWVWGRSMGTLSCLLSADFNRLDFGILGFAYIFESHLLGFQIRVSSAALGHFHFNVGAAFRRKQYSEDSSEFPDCRGPLD